MQKIAMADIDLAKDVQEPSNDFPSLIFADDLILLVSDLTQLLDINVVLEATTLVKMETPSNSPKAEDYQGFLLLPTLCKHGWRCDFSLPDDSFRSGSVIHNFPNHALAWGKQMVDTGRVLKKTQPRQFTDEPLKVRPFLSLLDSASGHHFPKSDRTHWLLAAYLLLHFGDTGTVSFWDEFLAATVCFKPRQLTKKLNELVRLGIIRYSRPPNRNCPTSYYIGPAWLSQEVTLTSVELEALEDGEVDCVEGAYLWQIPFCERFSQQERTLRHEGNAIVRVPVQADEPMWYCTWAAGEWTSRRKASLNADLESPIKKRITRTELITAFKQSRTTEIYKGHLLSTIPIRINNELCWYCDIELASGKRLIGARKSFSSVEDALLWAKAMIDLADRHLLVEEQVLAPPSDTATVHLLPYADVMLHKHLAKATNKHKLLLKFLIREFENQGNAHFWDYFLARAFTVTSQKFLNLCKELVKAGLIRYSRYDSAYMTSFYLGPAWLSQDGVALKAEELSALALGEQAASYRPWWTTEESYPGEKYGFPCQQKDHRNNHYFYQGSETRARWKFRHQDNALVRVAINPNHPTWYSTWHNGIWTHTQTATS